MSKWKPSRRHKRNWLWRMFQEKITSEIDKMIISELKLLKYASQFKLSNDKMKVKEEK